MCLSSAIESLHSVKSWLRGCSEGATFGAPRAMPPLNHNIETSRRVHAAWKAASSAAAERLPQLAFGAFEQLFLPLGEILAGAIDVKSQHRHRRLIRRAFAPLAGFGRVL